MSKERKHYSAEEGIAVLGRHLLGLNFCFLESIGIGESKGVGTRGWRHASRMTCKFPGI